MTEDTLEQITSIAITIFALIISTGVILYLLFNPTTNKQHTYYIDDVPQHNVKSVTRYTNEVAIYYNNGNVTIIPSLRYKETITVKRNK